MIPYGRHAIDEADIEAVVNVLRSDWLTQGPEIERFERAVAEYCGVPYAVAVNSGTSALHIACLAAGLAPGDNAWTSPNTFVASANAILYCGASPDFVDIGPGTGNMDVGCLADKLDVSVPKVLIPVHFAGLSCDMRTIAGLAQERGFMVIEDASHAIGGVYQDRPVGCCEHSDMTVFSFHPVKIVTTGEGGMVLTRRHDLYQSLLRLRSHGITRDPAQMEGEVYGPWYYQQLELGFNYRMTDFQAALGTSQLRRLDSFVAKRRELAARYDQILAGFPLRSQSRPDNARSAHHLYVVSLDDGVDRKLVFERMRAAGIGVNVHYIPVHTQPHYRRLGFRSGMFPVAEDYYRRAMTLPLFPGMSDDMQDCVVRSLAEALA